MESLRWRKSSRSSAGGPECVEIALVSSGAAVRDSKNADGARLRFGDAGWETFLAAAKTGSFVS
ncbi:uncharacterized protein DUF397 [Lentzea atacamensis]|uniref:Uncharacterized protein DUF397 n=3 Tax=Lentzea TaxID=165301 RepID=A0A316I8J8_9PSEU|nr:protein of unknown function (DUF397) [Lentzea flava]PWK88814.1 uncharacterized protein DUF397 [Lentzea atacamensis]GGU35931.1 DUF397 domain-containing protein [Lentzea flava]